MSTEGAFKGEYVGEERRAYPSQWGDTPPHPNELTRLAGRIDFVTSVETYIREYPGQFALLEIDLDGLKAINDEYGHVEGDEYIKNFSEVLRTLLRDEDMFINYPSEPFHKSGDEFSVLLDVSREEDLEIVKDRIQTVADELGIPISIGGHIHQPGEDIEMFKDAADKAMYADKIKRKTAEYEDRFAIIAEVLQTVDEYEINPRDLPMLRKILGMLAIANYAEPSRE